MNREKKVTIDYGSKEAKEQKVTDGKLGKLVSGEVSAECM